MCGVGNLGTNTVSDDERYNHLTSSATQQKANPSRATEDLRLQRHRQWGRHGSSIAERSMDHVSVALHLTAVLLLGHGKGWLEAAKRDNGCTVLFFLQSS